jgi:EVE domain
MAYWLKMIGMIESPAHGRYKWNFVDFAKNRRPRRVHPGDHVVLYAVGGSKRVFALAEVTSEVYEGGHEARFPYRVNVSYLINLDVFDGVHIDEISTGERDLVKSLMRASVIELRPEEYERAARKLREAASKQ